MLDVIFYIAITAEAMSGALAAGRRLLRLACPFAAIA